jgi:hypothetical protein
MESITLSKVNFAYGFVSSGTVVTETLLSGAWGQKIASHLPAPTDYNYK